MARREFKIAEKRKMLARSGGVCERARWREGEVCTKPAKEFDHLQSDALAGEPVAENGAHLCVPCHKEKTHEHDRPIIQKANNQRDAHQGITRKKAKIPQPVKAPKPIRDKLPLPLPRGLYA